MNKSALLLGLPPPSWRNVPPAVPDDDAAVVAQAEALLGRAAHVLGARSRGRCA